ncbi:MAG: amino acid--tRNA ligase-related protein [Syntrophorhabdus sp.]
MTFTDTKKLKTLLKTRHEFFKITRNFFYDRGYIEVETANLMTTAPPDPHIDPLEVYVGKRGPFFLHTSPEMGMKKLLRSGNTKIFQICKVFRVEELHEVHNTEFTMLEWYRDGDCRDAISETCDLIEYVANQLSIANPDRFSQPYAVQVLTELFRDIVGFDPFPLDRDAFFDALQKFTFPGIDDRDDWASLFFKVLIQEIEPEFKRPKPCVITGWPSVISTMAKQRSDRVNTVERFEIYINGLEIANGYTELLDAVSQRNRFIHDNNERLRMNKRQFPVDEQFLDCLTRIRGPIAGVSIGMDRLLMSFLEKDTIDEVLADRIII